MLIVLAGNPNAGKTTLFNALTRSNLKTGNFHGVTTVAARKTVKGVTFSDSPGTYSLKAYSMEEAGAVEEIKSADIIVNVIDALTLENSLRLTRELIFSGKRVVVYITKLSALKRRGGWVDKDKLSAYLGVPVFTCPPKQFKRALAGDIPLAAKNSQIPLNQAYYGGNYDLSRTDKLFYNRFFALFIFVLSIVSMFFFAFYPLMPGALLKGLIEKLLEIISNAITAKMQSEIAISVLSEGVIGGAGCVLAFIPQLAILYLFLTVLDESGITSALSFCTDGLFEKVNLSGRTAFTLVAGFGCTTAAIATTRGYVSESAKRRTVAVLPYIPCAAKLPVFLTFLSPVFKNPFLPITALYFAGLALSIAISCFLKGAKEGMISEVAPVFAPSPKSVCFKLFFYLKGFIIKVTCTVMLFCIISWTLSHFSFTFKFVTPENSMLQGISAVLLPLFKPMGITDWRIAYAALCGAIAKENIAATVGMLMPLGANLSAASALALCAFVLLSPACISAFSASLKEVGFKFTLKCVIIQTVTAFLGAYAVYFLFSL